MKRLPVILLCALCFAAVPAAAQSDTSDDWHFQVAPLYLWAVSLDGTMALPTGLENDFQVDFSDAVDNLQTAFTIHFEASKGRWGILADVSYLNFSGDQPINTPGETADLKVKNYLYEAAGAYEFASSWWVIAGARYFKLDPKVSFQFDPLPELNPSASWTDFFAGVMWRPQLGEKWTFSGRFDIGAGGSDLVWNAAALIDYRLGPWAAVFAGWRHMDYDYGDDITFDVSMSGPVAAFRFFW